MNEDLLNGKELTLKDLYTLMLEQKGDIKSLEQRLTSQFDSKMEDLEQKLSEKFKVLEADFEDLSTEMSFSSSTNRHFARGPIARASSPEFNDDGPFAAFGGEPRYVPSNLDQ